MGNHLNTVAKYSKYQINTPPTQPFVIEWTFIKSFQVGIPITQAQAKWYIHKWEALTRRMTMVMLQFSLKTL